VPYNDPVRALILGCLVLAACNGASPSSPSDSPALRLTATISQAVLQPGDIATLTFRLENTGTTAVTLQFPSACQVSPYIETAPGTVVYPGGGQWACAQVVTTLTLAPGGSKVEELQVRGGTSQMSSAPGLPPGDYGAYARIDGSATLQSGKVAFTVR